MSCLCGCLEGMCCVNAWPFFLASASTGPYKFEDFFHLEVFPLLFIIVIIN